ncbi:MAG: serine--tRNA ligase [Actinomycetota bacterium]|nr:serine--tRNA ligase [Actinomycetota bacterium]MDQ3574251.1 serine--tRNA ligase [Actinomycetota bacterium]
MIDIRLVRDQPDHVKAALARKGVDGAEVERAVDLDSRRREVTRSRDVIRARVKTISKAVGVAKRSGDEARARELAEESRRLGDEARAHEAATAAVEGELHDLLLRIPNLPAEDAPDGSSEADNVVLRVEGYDPERYQAHQRVPHWDIGTELGILDLERGAKISGSMFVMYRGAGALLVRALCQLGLDHNSDAFEEIRPPTLVRSDTLIATGQLPKFADEAYHVERDDLWAIPTAEVPLTSLAREEILAEEDLPVRLMAHTSCFRREAGAAGRDTRGLLRVHEFDKVEILAYAAPSQAAAVHADLLGRAEAVLTRLGLPYRVVDICAGDLGQPHARTFDLEVYAPGCDQWLEVSSVTWFSDYQARRANIRYRPRAEKGTALVHTVNGSALAVPRVWAALVETNRQPDGSVLIPEVLRSYMRGLEVITSGRF